MAGLDEGACDGDHARVCLCLISPWHSDLTALKSRLCGDAEFMRSIWQRYIASATNSNTGITSGACVFTLFVATLQCLITSRPSLLSVSAQMQGVGVPTSDSLLYSHSHSLDSIAEMVVTAASATMSNVMGMVGTEAGLSVQSAAMKVQWCILPSQSPTSFY